MIPIAKTTPSYLNSTPNCARCSRIQEHTTCEIVHLVDGSWIIERIPSFLSRVKFANQAARGTAPA